MALTQNQACGGTICAALSRAGLDVGIMAASSTAIMKGILDFPYAED
jgi:hypothetical protein